MRHWGTKRLGDLCTQVTVGHVGKMSDQYIDAGVPFLRSQDIRPGSIEVGSLKFISPEFHQKLRKSRLTPGDVAIVRTGYPGTAAVIPESLPDANCADLVIARPGPDLDARYLAFVLNSPWGKGQINGRLVGAAQQHFNVRVAQALEVPFPPLDTQRRIAAILGAYDDLIEVNRRRVAVLEEMARGLFEEWFVRFRFPGHESVPIVDTPNGPLPEGWRRIAIGNLFEHTIGGLWGEAEVSTDADQPVAVIRGTDFPRLLSGQYDSVPERFVSSKELSKRRLKAGDLILEASGGSKDQPVGRALFATRRLLEGLGGEVAPASFCRLLRCHQEPGLAEYVHGLLQAMYADRRIEKFQKQSTGLRNLSMKQLAAEHVVKPDLKTLRPYGSQVRPLIDVMSVHRDENRVLAAARDLILPRLISGQLSVEAAERDLELAA